MKNSHSVWEISFFILLISLFGGCLGGKSESGDGGGGSTVTFSSSTGVLQSITISPTSSSVSACVPVQYTATAHYSDATTLDVTSSLNWLIHPASSGVAIAAASNGMVMGIAPGSAVVHAWVSSYAASAVLDVSSGSLNSIAITPASSTIAATATQTYTASASCTNGTVDISAMNIWASSSPSVATISTAGVAQAVAAGSSVISATAGVIAASAVLSVQ
jgi:hypothetical protein